MAAARYKVSRRSLKMKLLLTIPVLLDPVVRKDIEPSGATSPNAFALAMRSLLLLAGCIATPLQQPGNGHCLSASTTSLLPLALPSGWL